MDDLQALKYCIASSVTEIMRSAKRLDEALARYEASTKCDVCGNELSRCTCFDISRPIHEQAKPTPEEQRYMSIGKAIASVVEEDGFTNATVTIAGKRVIILPIQPIEVLNRVTLYPTKEE